MSNETTKSLRPGDRVLRLLFGALLVIALVGAVLAGALIVWSAHDDHSQEELRTLGLTFGLYSMAFFVVHALVTGTTLWAVRARSGHATAVAALAAGGTLVGLTVTPLARPGGEFPTYFWFVPGISLIVVLVRWEAALRERRNARQPPSSPR